MTRKDYEKFAYSFKSCKPTVTVDHPTISKVQLEQWRWCVKRISAVLQNDNPRFDMQRFLNACDY